MTVFGLMTNLAAGLCFAGFCQLPGVRRVVDGIAAVILAVLLLPVAVLVAVVWRRVDRRVNSKVDVAPGKPWQSIAQRIYEVEAENARIADAVALERWRERRAAALSRGEYVVDRRLGSRDEFIYQEFGTSHNTQPRPFWTDGTY